MNYYTRNCQATAALEFSVEWTRLCARVREYRSLRVLEAFAEACRCPRAVAEGPASVVAGVVHATYLMFSAITVLNAAIYGAAAPPPARVAPRRTSDNA